MQAQGLLALFDPHGRQADYAEETRYVPVPLQDRGPYLRQVAHQTRSILGAVPGIIYLIHQ